MQAANFNVEMIKHTAEMKAAAEAERALLVKQLEDMRLARFWLYAFKLGDRRYKIGYAANVDERERQHQTTCPTGRNVHVVRVSTKYTEKLLDSVLKKHLNHVRGEEYEIEEGDRVVMTILNTIARVEEAVHTLPYDQFDNLLEHVDAALRGDKIVKSKDGRVAQELLRPYCEYVSNHLVVTSDPLDRISYADIVKECRTRLERHSPDHSDVFTVDAAHLKIGGTDKKTVQHSGAPIWHAEARRSAGEVQRLEPSEVRRLNPKLVELFRFSHIFHRFRV
jgi:hypothetical protein